MCGSGGDAQALGAHGNSPAMSDGRTARSRPSTRTGRLIRRPMRPTGRVWRFELMARKVGAATTAVNRHGPALRRRFVGRARRDRERVGEGKRVAVRGDAGGGRSRKKKTK